MDEEVFDDYSIEERELKQEEADSDRAKEKQKLDDSFAAVLSTRDGVAVFKRIFELTGYDDNLMRFNPGTGEINATSCVYNLSKRDVWRDLRRHIIPPHLSLIELPGE